jgi:hypothetical protein
MDIGTQLEGKPMSHISKLKLSQSRPETGNLPPKERARAKALAYLAQQLAMVQGELSGEPFMATRTVSRTLPDGTKTRVQQPAHIRRGWWTDCAGTTYFSIRYGAKPLALDKTGNSTVEIGKLDALPGVIETLVQSVKAGELDAVLTTAVAERKRNFGKRKSGVKAS